MEEISLDNELNSDIKKLIYSRMNNFLQEKIENPKKILVFELFSTRTIKKQLIVSDLDYFR